MPNLNLDLDYFDHPKIKRLVALLGPGAELHPIKLWCYVGRFHTKDGSFPGYSDAEIEGLAGWGGEKGAMISAMMTVKLLEKDSKGLIKIHDWKNTNGHLIAFKKRASKAATIRWGRATSITKPEPKQSPYQPSLPTIPYQPAVPTSVGQVAAAGQTEAKQGQEPRTLPVNGDGTDFDAFLIQQWGREGRPGYAIVQAFQLLAKTHGWDRVRYAVSEAAKHNIKNIAYVKGILEPREKLDKLHEEVARLVEAKRIK